MRNMEIFFWYTSQENNSINLQINGEIFILKVGACTKDDKSVQQDLSQRQDSSPDSALPIT